MTLVATPLWSERFIELLDKDVTELSIDDLINGVQWFSLLGNFFTDELEKRTLE